MTADQGNAGAPGGDRDAGGPAEYGGTDALMAAITGEALPAGARRDPVFLAAHRAAQADVAVLREGLARLAGALTGEAAREETASGGRTHGDRADERRTGAEGPAGAEAAGDIATDGTVPTGSPAPPPVTPRPRRRPRPAGAARPPRPGRAGGRRRAVRGVLGTLAGAVVFALVLGFGWMVTRGGGTADGGGDSAAGGADAAGSKAVSGGRWAEPERRLACSRLVVEGTVARVERRPEDSGSRVTLTVTRSYKPADGPADVTVLLGADARPAPRAGQHVLVGVEQGERYATLWAVGDTRVATERAWITTARSGSRDAPCPVADDTLQQGG
ncbi:hypothetical protein AB0E62_06680 [Streptomyces sp. NPDC038707]|uniref:hypothetical protein n=1 Tax=Streptomyces sp. NPDC038707 TaxID=3154329 RepID=UPI0033CFC58C